MKKGVILVIKGFIVAITILIMMPFPIFGLWYEEIRNHSDEEIINDLSSTSPNTLAMGAFYAGESGKKIFIPLLLTNAHDPRRCTNMRFEGFSVYQEKMNALGKILQLSPPVKIEKEPDSAVIKFYTKVSSKYNKQ